MTPQNIVLVIFLTHVAINLDALKFRVPLQQRRQHSTPTAPRKYRQLDVQEEFSRRRSGVRVPSLDIDRFKNDLSSTPLLSHLLLHNGKDRVRNDPPLETKRGRNGAQQIVSNVHELREKVLDEKVPLRDLKVELVVANATVSELINHEVVQLIAERFRSQSKPGARGPDDKAVLALAIEGGGIRGAVCSGMAAAIASLGLTDSFDTILGSSAGSVIGAYMVSRQMCVDVYLDILPAAKQLFVCVKRMAKSLVVTAIDHALSHVQAGLPKFSARALPGMNISFVLDGIMDDSHGLRPLDLESFRANDLKQPLRVASSYVKDGKLYTKCFGTKNFFSGNAESVRRVDGQREGIYACLEASMTVPGATGDPVRLVDNTGYNNSNESIAFFDAFCFEPLPYRSAVEAGATHVLVLCSRPEGFQPKTTPGVYERGVANLYFRSHNEPEVAEFFEQGGQQYIYAEDLLTLEEGKRAGTNPAELDGIRVPPPQVLYGVDRDESTERVASNRESWKKAHILPLKVPIGTKELPTLEQERDAVGEAVRGGFAAAFDLLAPAIGVKLDNGLTGAEVAKLLFPPDVAVDERVLKQQLRVKGDSIPYAATPVEEPSPNTRRRKRDILLPVFGLHRRRQVSVSLEIVGEEDQVESLSHAEHLLKVLPGFASGRMAHLATNLHGVEF